MKKQIYLTLVAVLFSISAAWAFPSNKGKLLQGFQKTISGKEHVYASHPTQVKDALIATTDKSTTPMEWVGEAPAADDKGVLNFVFVTGASRQQIGKQSPDYNLYVNGEKLITFNIKSEASWRYQGAKQSELLFEGYQKDAWNNYLGYMFFTIPAKNIERGKEVTFRIEGTNEGSDNWLMIFRSPATHEVNAICTPTVLKGSNKQLVKINYIHYGKPSGVEIEFNGQKRKEDARFGINSFEVVIDKVTEPSSKELKVISKEGTVTAMVDLTPAKPWEVKFLQHTHTDIGYTRPQHEILSEHIRFIDYALDYCDQTDNYPDDAKFRWTCESAWSVSEYLRIRPKEQIDRLMRRIKEGRIEVTAMYFNYDELPSEQELAYSLYPLKEFSEKGIPVQLAMQNDVNGIAWSFSEFFPDLGVKYLIMGTHGHKALISFDKPTAFWWESPSGKRTLTFRAEHYNHGNALHVEKGNFEEFENRMLKYLRDLEAKNYPHNIVEVQYSGYFTDNSPPSTAGSDMIKLWNNKYEYPKLRMSVASEFMQAMEEKHGKDLPVFRAAWPDWWTDGFGSAAREAAIFRYAQADVMSNQISLSLAKVLGANIHPSINREISETNKALLFYGEHTFGFHNSIAKPFDKETMEQRSHKAAYAWESYRRSRPLGEAALGLLQQYIPRNKDNASIVVFNPLNWAHSGYTTIYADHEVMPINKKTIVRDENGNEVQKQIIRSYADASYWALWVDNVPALGLKRYTIDVSEQLPTSYDLVKDAVVTIENKWYRIVLDSKNGVVTEWFDKEMNKNLISQNSKWKMGELIYERDDVRGALDRFKPGNFERFSPTDVKYIGCQGGDIWDSYKFKGTSPAGMGSDNFTFEIRVYKTRKQVDFTYRLNKKMETEPESLYVSFPFELEGGKIFFDVPGGTIQAVKDQITGSTNDWNTVQNFASVRNDSHQIILGSREIPLMQFGNINLGRFKADAMPETNHIFTWPMNNYWVTNFNADQHGEFEWTYYLTSSNDSSVEYATKFAWDNRMPLPNRVIPAGVSDEKAQVSGSILTIDPSNVLLVNMTPVEGENALILQLREIGGESCELKISSTFNKNIKIVECDPLGREQTTGSQVMIKAWENKFVKLKL